MPRSPNWQSKQMQPNAINTALNRFSYVEDIILHIFYFVATNMPDLPRHSQAKLYPCELVTIGILFALKGGYFRAFYPWLKRDYGTWFGDGSLPERTRLQRLLKTHRDWCDLFLADPSFFTVIDSYPIELIFPIRQGRSSLQVGKKGRDKGRWSVGIKLCWLLNDVCRVVGWDWDTMNVYDKRFHHHVQSISAWISTPLTANGVMAEPSGYIAYIPSAEKSMYFPSGA